MPEFPVDSKRQPMLATGIVNAVMEWGQNPDGRRMKTEVQDRDPDTGMLTWDFEVLYTGSNFGQDCTITANVTVGSADKPNPAPMTPVTFEGLSVSVFLNRAGGITERWQAEAIADLQPRSKPTATSTNTSSSSKSSSSSGNSSSAAA